MSDINDIKRAVESTLHPNRVQDEQYKTILRTTLDGFWLADKQGKFLDVNEAYCRLIGYSREELLTMNVSDIEAVESAEQTALHIKKIIKIGGDRFETRHRSKNGEIVDLEVSVNYLDTEGGRFFVFLRDITEQKKAREELLKSRNELEIRVQERTKELEETNQALQAEVSNRTQAEQAMKNERQRLYDVLETLPAYVVLLSKDYHVPFASRFFRERFGESHGKRCFEYLFQRTEPCENCETFKALKTNAPYHWEWTGPDNRNYDIYDYPFTDTDGSTMILEMGIDITKRKQAEAALRKAHDELEKRVQERTKELKESEENYSRIVETTNEGVLVFNLDGKIRFANQRIAEMLGYANSEGLLGKVAVDEFTEPDQKAAILNTRQELETGLSLQREFKLRRKDGSILWVNSNASPLLDNQGHHFANLAMFTDITERKQAEENLRQTSNYLENLFNYANAPIICWDTKFKITRFNHAFERLTGYTADEAIGKNLSILFPENTREESLSKINRTLSGEYWEVVEIPILRKNGDIRIVLWNSANIYAEDGKTLLATIAQGQDITERKQAEDNLRETSDYLNKLFNYANAPIIVWDPAYRINRFNLAFERLTGKKAEEVLGKDIGILFPSDRREESLAHIRRTTMQGLRWEVLEIPILHTDGTVRTVLWNSANVYSADKKTIIATIAQGQDITERKKAEEDLRRSNENLEQFAYIASHDLQEPLRTITSFTQLLENRYKAKLDNDADEFINFIVDAAKRMQNMITDILMYSRAGSPLTVDTKIDCDKVLSKVIASMSQPIELNHAVITHDTLPVLTFNENNLIQLFQNLISNAIKFRRDEPPRVHISAQKQKGKWIFSVRDNGIGIDDKYQEKIFLIFQRLHPRDKYQGTGIGLAICKKIVEMYGGRIWVESTKGKGSTFYFTIPAKTEKEV